MDSILIAGASGFLGRNLVPLLLKKNINLILFTTGNSNFNFKSLASKKNIIVANKRNIKKIINNNKISTFLNLQVSFSYFHNIDSLREMLEANISVPMELAELCSEKKCFKRLITATTFHVYSKGSDKFCPANVFSGTKESFSVLAESLAINKNFLFDEVVVYDTFGEGDNRKKIVSIINNAIDNNQTLKLSPGKQVIDLSHITNIAEGFLKLIFYKNKTRSKIKKQYFASSGNRIKLQELAKIIEEIKMKKLKAKWGAFDYRKGEVLNPIMPKKGTNICKKDNLRKRLSKFLI